ncbi:CzcE family metal-binding protein [Roseateles sp. PN1]|uniref:CzcE family metal-binding protein n=1 Tax=Roseateles sp. PN1 TaxID=3137372 RepID=UPI0031394FBF
MNTRNVKTVILAAVLVLTGHAAIAANGTTLSNGNSVYGVPTTPTASGKVVDLSKAPKSLNVNCGDVISFRDGDKTFTWKFDVIGHQSVNLAAIAPAGFSTQSLKIHVSRNEGEGS